MESGFLTLIIFSSLTGYFSHLGMCFTDWDDVVITREDRPTTLVCTDTTMTGATAINWRMKSFVTENWKLVLVANEQKEFSGGASKADMRLVDQNFQDTGVFSLFFLPKMEDIGLYSCLIKQQERKLKEKTILLAILTVSVFPATPIPQLSTLRLIARINPDSAATKVTWVAPGVITMKSEVMQNTGTVAKRPQVENSDNGDYVCRIHPRSNSSKAFFTFNVNVTIDADNVVSFTDIIHVTEIVTAAQADTPFLLQCPQVKGDYVRLQWRPPDMQTYQNIMKVYEFDRWRGSTMSRSQKVRLAGSPYDAQAGIFSFLLTPMIDGGLYICEVFLNDNAFSQRTMLSVLKVTTSHSPSKLELWCEYTERSKVQIADWKYQDQSRQLQLSNHSHGTIIAILPLPITPDTAGNYTCTLQLKNGQTIQATHTVTLPPEDVTTPSLPASLSALLLLVPLLSAAVGVLLWRQKHISERGIEQSLSVYSGEVENIYENPEDIRQVPPQGSVYMDLKPRGEDDVYKELERYEQCHS